MISDEEFAASLRVTAETLPELELGVSGILRTARHMRAARFGGKSLGIFMVAIAALAGAGTLAGRGPFSPPFSVAGPASPGPSATSASDACVDGADCLPSRGPVGWTLEQQDMLAPYAARIAEIAASSPGFGSTAVLYAPSRIEVYWQGALPIELQELIVEARVDGVSITHVDCLYSAAELENAARVLGRALDGRGIDWTGIVPTASYGGLIVSGPRVSVESSLQEAVRDVAAEEIGTYPITFGPDEGPITG